MLLFLLVLYLLPQIINGVQNIRLVTLSDVRDGLGKLLPFKKGYFDNDNFTFSFITESILAILVLIIFWGGYI